ncbi:murein hydrolase activator EnvC [Magnetospira sp. QH-2]|uniref:murein hydrolase activator EnvC family protein n=1 Tax=Magnetospira sp. (strain QH-2) TaxID=1288970 RepID=UPI0005F9FFC8|nr:peptidoglycan DD-metalloendopeptidase family protein [Magnetospira sp. QH-2]
MAAPAEQELEQTQKALEQDRERQKSLQIKAEQVKQELETLRRTLVKAGSKTQGQEKAVEKIEDRLADLETEEAIKRDDLLRQRKQFDGLLLAVQRLARYPPEALLALPNKPAETVRAAILLRATLPEVRQRTEVLRQQVASLTDTRAALEREKTELQRANESLGREQRDLDKLLRRKAELYNSLSRESAAAAKRVAALARKSKDLHDLVNSLDKERQETERKKKAAQAKNAQKQQQQAARQKAAAKPLSAARGKLPFPALGRIVVRYGQKERQGATSKGLTFETRRNARVIAPHAGKVVFAGPFRGYGRLLIIEHGEGYHTLLAGMDRIDGTIGQIVLAGEPIGVMGTPKTGRPTLYLELRRNSQPINPLPWLAAKKGKANG